MPASAVAIIPARMGSTRFPAKALADDTGLPLVVHVCRQTRHAKLVERIVVATDDRRIADAARDHGFNAVITAGDHPNGTSRLAEAASILELHDDCIVVNVQGDEPEIEPAVIDGAIAACAQPLPSGIRPTVGTVASPIRDSRLADNPNVVKVVLGQLHTDRTGMETGQALYFSRSNIPHDRDGSGAARCLRHVGVYAYSVRALRGYPALAETPLERAERLEQLRWLEHGHAIAAAVRESAHTGIDTPDQYRAFVERWREKIP